MRQSTMLVLLASMMFLPGCDSVQQMLGGMDRPTARIKDVRFAGLSLEQADMLFDIEVTNPYAVALPLARIDYGLASGGAAIVSGRCRKPRYHLC